MPENKLTKQTSKTLTNLGAWGRESSSARPVPCPWRRASPAGTKTTSQIRHTIRRSRIWRQQNFSIRYKLKNVSIYRETKDKYLFQTYYIIRYLWTRTKPFYLIYDQGPESKVFIKTLLSPFVGKRRNKEYCKSFIIFKIYWNI
mgnify:CR=1 FL=1